MVENYTLWNILRINLYFINFRRLERRSKLATIRFLWKTNFHSLCYACSYYEYGNELQEVARFHLWAGNCKYRPFLGFLINHLSKLHGKSMRLRNEIYVHFILGRFTFHIKSPPLLSRPEVVWNNFSSIFD